MKLDNQCFLNHKSNLQKEWSQDGCRSCMDECGLRVTEARAEDEGEWECKYELPGQSDKVGHHLSFLDSSLWDYMSPSPIPCKFESRFEGFCMLVFVFRKGMEIRLLRYSKLLLSSPRTQRPKVVTKLNPQTFSEYPYHSLLVCQPWMTPHSHLIFSYASSSTLYPRQWVSE